MNTSKNDGGTGTMDPTEVGSVFISNYPPYSFWSNEAVSEVPGALDAPPHPDATLGLYIHIPFCRLRCKFCYYKVYTDKDSRQVRRYLDALGREVELFADRPAEMASRTSLRPSMIESKRCATLSNLTRSSGTRSWIVSRRVEKQHCRSGSE